MHPLAETAMLSPALVLPRSPRRDSLASTAEPLRQGAAGAHLVGGRADDPWGRPGPVLWGASAGSQR
jgi:hypothetical protein